MRYASNVDANQGDIVDALRAIGATVELLHRVGGGVPDLLVGYRGTNHCLEVKDGSKAPSDRRLTPDQIRWHGAWRGRVHVVINTDEAIAVVTKGQQ